MDVIADLSNKLIQRNLIQPKLERGYLAFDKCTLLSSQGSDAPADQPHDQPHRATSLLLHVPPARQPSDSRSGTAVRGHLTKPDQLPALRLFRPLRWATSLSYPSRSACQIGCSGLFESREQHSSTLRGVGTSILRPETRSLKLNRDGGRFSA